MIGYMRISQVDLLLLIRVLLVLWLWRVSVAVAHKKQGEWGEWGACSATCGTGQRSREGCRKKPKHGQTCPSGHVRTQTEECSSSSCTLSSSNAYVQAGSSPGEKTSAVVALSASSSSVLSSDKLSSATKGEWGEWGACSATCGIGKRSRETCKTEFKPGNTCPPRQVTTQIEECTVSCILSSSNVQAWSSQTDKASIVIIITPTSSLMVVTSLSGMMTPSVALTSRPFVLTSSVLVTTSASAPVVTMLSTQFNHVLRTSTASLGLLASSFTESTYRDVTSSITTSSVTSSLFLPASSAILVVTSSSPSKTSPLPGSSSSILTSSALKMASSSVSVIPKSPNNSNGGPQKSSTTSSLFSPASSSSLAVTSSSPSKMSSLSRSSSSILTSPALIMTSSSVSTTPDPKSPNKSDQDPHKSPSSLQAYFNVAEKGWVLLNHVIKSVWSSTEITCAMFCIRDQNCQSFNFKCTAEYSSLLKNVDTKTYHNCQLNSAKHSTHPRDFFAKEGYCYYYL